MYPLLMIVTSRSLSSLLVGAAVTMVAISSLATVAMTSAVHSDSTISLSSFFVMLACSSGATILVFSRLHAELGLRERQALTEARTDPLTGLSNRKAMVEALEHVTHGCKDAAAPSSLVLIDLNNFKNVNDSLGHEMGDELLVQVANRLRAKLPENQIFRLGGDEFAALLTGMAKGEAKDACRRLHQEIAGSYALGETHAKIGCSLGVAEVETNLTSSDLMHRADLAMYRAKRARSFVEAFDQRMQAEQTRKAELCDRLRQALKQGTGIALKYQPIFSRELRVEALEVYFRWHDEEFGAISPREAVQIARLTQQIDSLGLMVVASAVNVLERNPTMIMCINVEAMQFLDTRFAEALEQIVISRGCETSHFQLEFEEADIAAYGAKLAPVLRGLADSGFTIAVDNFGASASSLTELRSLGISAVKLDHSLLIHARETRNISLLRAQVKLAAALGMKVTCKRIGDQEDETIAIQAGCDFLQGFKYGRPDSADAFLGHPEKILRRVIG